MITNTIDPVTGDIILVHFAMITADHPRRAEVEEFYKQNGAGLGITYASVAQFAAENVGKLAEKLAAERATPDLRPYRADVAFSAPCDPRHEVGHTLRYLAAGDEAAVRDAFRWAQNRIRAWFVLLPDEGLRKHLALKVYRLHLSPIDAAGNGGLDTGPQVYEWKHDTGERGLVAVGAPAAMFDRRDPP